MTPTLLFLYVLAAGTAMLLLALAAVVLAALGYVVFTVAVLRWGDPRKAR